MELLGGAEAHRQIDRQAHDVVVEIVAVCMIDPGFGCVLVIHRANGGGVVAKKREGCTASWLRCWRNQAIPHSRPRDNPWSWYQRLHACNKVYTCT